MKQQQLDVTLRILKDSLPTVMAICDARTIAFLYARPAHDGAEGDDLVARPPVLRRAMRYVNGKRNKGISAHALLIKVLTEVGRPMNIEELNDVFQAHGFHPRSANPSLSQLAHQGLVERLAKGMWALKNNAVHA